MRFIIKHLPLKTAIKILSAVAAIKKNLQNFKTMASKLVELILNGISGPAAEVFADKFADVLRKIKPAETRRDLMVTLYVPIDTQLEKITDATKTKLDDAAVYALKTAIETVAAEDGVKLPNIDGD